MKNQNIQTEQRREKWNENVEECSGCGIKWKKIGKQCPVCYCTIGVKKPNKQIDCNCHYPFTCDWVKQNSELKKSSDEECEHCHKPKEQGQIDDLIYNELYKKSTVDGVRIIHEDVWPIEEIKQQLLQALLDMESLKEEVITPIDTVDLVGLQKKTANKVRKEIKAEIEKLFE